MRPAAVRLPGDTAHRERPWRARPDELRAADFLGIHAPLPGRRTSIRTAGSGRMGSMPAAGPSLLEYVIVQE